MLMIVFSPQCINCWIKGGILLFLPATQLRDFYRPRVLAPEDPELLFPLEPDDELSVLGV